MLVAVAAAVAAVASVGAVGCYSKGLFDVVAAHGDGVDFGVALVAGWLLDTPMHLGKSTCEIHRNSPPPGRLVSACQGRRCCRQ